MPGTSELLFSGKATQERKTIYSLTKWLVECSQFYCRKHILIKTPPNTSLLVYISLFGGDMSASINLPNLSITHTHAFLLTILLKPLEKK